MFPGPGTPLTISTFVGIEIAMQRLHVEFVSLIKFPNIKIHAHHGSMDIFS